MKNILIISLLGVFLGFFTGCAPVTCEELDKHANTVRIGKGADGTIKVDEIVKADIFKTAGSKKMAKKSYTDGIEAYAALKKGAEAKLTCKFSYKDSDEWKERDYEVDLAALKSDFENREKEAKEELKKLK